MTFRPSLAMLLKALRPRRAARRPKTAPPRRLEAELLQDRTTPTFISVTVHFINQTPSTLYFLGGSASHGKFTDPHPPDTIAPGGSATWETENRDGSVGTGTEATATYQIGTGAGKLPGFAQLPALKPGDVVEVDGGASYGPLLLKIDGTAAQKITVRGIRVMESWGEIVGQIQKEQGGRSPLRVFVYPCAPLQILN